MVKKNRSGKPLEIFTLAKPYSLFIFIIFVVSLLANGMSLFVPKYIAIIIDGFQSVSANINNYFLVLAVLIALVFVLSTVQTILQTYLSEKIGLDLRSRLIHKISTQRFAFINEITPEKLLTNLTGDVDNIKQVIALGLVQIFSSIILIVGAAIFLISINVSLGLIVLTIIPLIIVVFALIFSQISQFFKKAQANVDSLNKTINESIVAASLIRILNSQNIELQKFQDVNSRSRDISMSILRLFASLIPLISMIANLSIVAVLLLGGKSIISGSFTIGGLTAFLNYISMLIFPIIIIGFISNLFARASASFERISSVLFATDTSSAGTVVKNIDGKISFKNVSLKYGNKQILKDVTFDIPARSRTAILGPTAAGKTQIFYLLSGLLSSSSGSILIDDIPQSEYSPKCIADQLGLVFQDSSIFNTTIRENINFKNIDNEKQLQKAIETAELQDFVNSLPDGLETKIAERGATLSGGQKQRITLARALVIDPKIILLDDFTARVDRETEKRIFLNLKHNYPDITQILITQQISSIKDFDQIILMMEGELLAVGTHAELLDSSPEYQQIYNSQFSTEE